MELVGETKMNLNVDCVVPLRGYSDKPEFYVYIHRKPNGEVFYVGKGKGRRAWSKANRNAHWKHVIEKYHDYSVQIVDNCLTEQAAFELEQFLIEWIGIDKLTNQTLGGISTTGFRHSIESKQLQSLIAKQRLLNRPDLVENNRRHMAILHDKQRNDPKYRQQMSDLQKELWSALPESEKQSRISASTSWVKTQEGKEYLSHIATARMNDPLVKKNLSNAVKAKWNSLSTDERERRCEKLSLFLNSPDVRAKLVEAISHKIVINKRFIFSSKKQFLEIIGSADSVLQKAFKSARKHGFTFAILKGFLVEDYDASKHCSLPTYNGEALPKLDFDCLPRSKAVVMDDSVVFLSMNEASVFCSGRTVEATADFITKNMKIGKPAMGHNWRVATNLEIENEIMKRVSMLEVST